MAKHSELTGDQLHSAKVTAFSGLASTVTADYPNQLFFSLDNQQLFVSDVNLDLVSIESSSNSSGSVTTFSGDPINVAPDYDYQLFFRLFFSNNLLYIADPNFGVIPLDIDISILENRLDDYLSLEDDISIEFRIDNQSSDSSVTIDQILLFKCNTIDYPSQSPTHWVFLTSYPGEFFFSVAMSDFTSAEWHSLVILTSNSTVWCVVNTEHPGYITDGVHSSNYLVSVEDDLQNSYQTEVILKIYRRRFLYPVINLKLVDV